MRKLGSRRDGVPLERAVSLGRVFNVTRQRWSLGDDPKKVRPKTQLVSTGHTAADAADLARRLAEDHRKHGFHKASGCWWGPDETDFHRFVVRPGRRRRASAAVMAASGVLALGVVAFLRSRRFQRP